MLKVFILLTLIVCLVCFYKCRKYRKKTLELVIVEDSLRAANYSALHSVAVWVGIVSGLILGLLISQLF